ncbi:AraC family transcriptional regulator [Salegentibacter salinarum]|uniref:AraC family transcriptional regulator n=1 Tax=Salegentibacter salinarum TaxID=447422 RepID=A0A2N0U482_9FLAO|nr:helix-turn-helix transcriptional regulator [Salegentibacter salinarum]PKD21794.1 AraC family transcriptional regulator [Salegentibacter salinarum]SKB33521.1 AraC-type DNA-binding protein [Salegentibacter salinarum]
MEHTSKYLTPEIKLSCYEDSFFKSDIVFDQHMLIWFISGETKIIQADATHHFKTGDIFLIPRNIPATIINYPKDGLPHKTVVMLLTTKILRSFYAGTTSKHHAISDPKIRSFSNHPLLESCLASLIPYFEMKEPFPVNLASLKIVEAISILRAIDNKIDRVLDNFDDPHKVELISFMEKNYMFNMPIHKYAYLTGRSLTTFKRDFKKTFDTTPRRWLTRKRLELAHYQLTQKKRKPVEVCYESGFENLSHFSFAFKKHFGYSPKNLMQENLLPSNAPANSLMTGNKNAP